MANDSGAPVPVTRIIIGAAIAVHDELGPGLLESAYRACLDYELSRRGLHFRREVAVPVVYRGVRIDCGYRLDFIVGDSVVVEVKSVSTLAPVHVAQMITYLKLTRCPVGLLMNFNATSMRNGVRRVPNRDWPLAETDRF